MNYIKAPDDEWQPSWPDPEWGIFMAGAITGAEDWQDEMFQKLKQADLDEPYTLMNPRRHNWDMQDPNAPREQIEWEYRHLQMAGLVTFFFPKDAMAPITLFELGAALHQDDKDIIIAVEKGYWRELDVRIQAGLQRPEVPIVSTLDELVKATKFYIVNGDYPDGD